LEKQVNVENRAALGGYPSHLRSLCALSPGLPSIRNLGYERNDGPFTVCDGLDRDLAHPSKSMGSDRTGSFSKRRLDNVEMYQSMSSLRKFVRIEKDTECQ
jgi:hypothetical protein